MKRHTLPTAAAFAAAAALFLTGCGSGSDSDDKIAGAEQGESSGQESPEASPSSSAEVSDFGLPDDLKVEISPDKTGNKGKDAVLAAQADVLMARQRLFVDLDPGSRYLDVYFSGEAQAFYKAQIAAAKKRGKTISGTYRYYDRKVTRHTSDIALVSYCEDQTKAVPKDVKTKKVRPAHPTPEDYTRYETVLKKSPGGVWQLDRLSGRSNASECK
ncbi:hypothetical protein [Streptomyces sp. NPDC087300]|uniref:hypothetical protein n=1 Tax=Streptomyces sp. NPDC087300 TaxID=3365780 RepID=UPI0037F818D4